MEFVRDLLRSTFAIGQARAIRLVLQIHEEGVAVVRRVPHAEAVRLADVATRAARAAGFPLTISVVRSTNVRSVDTDRAWLLRLANRSGSRRAVAVLAGVPSPPARS